MKFRLAVLIGWWWFVAAHAQLNPGHGGAWFNPETPGQGIMVEILPEADEAFVAWFTYDTLGTKVGTPKHRWLTGQGPVSGRRIDLTLFVTEGGAFDTATPTTTTPVGSAVLNFPSCTEGSFEYELDEGLSGGFDLVRISSGSHCLELAAEAVDLPLEVDSSRRLAIVDVTVIPMTDDRPEAVENQTVLVQDRRIVSVGAAGDVQIPAGAEVIRAPGAFLMPGLVDTHTHLATNMSEFLNILPPASALDDMADNQLMLYLANGVTTIFNLGDFGEPLPRWAAEVRNGERPGPTIYAAQYARGAPGTPDGGPAGRSIRGSGDAPEFTRAAHRAGYQMMKVYNWTPADGLSALVAEARALGMPVAGHIPQTVDGLSFLASGDLDLLAHSEAYTWAIFGWGQRPDDLPPAIEATVQGAVFLSATLGIVETIAQVWCGDSDGIAAFWGLPEVAYMSSTEVRLHHEGMTTARWNPDGCAVDAYEPQVPYMYELVRRMHQAGVPVLLGTDSPTVLGAAGFSALRELAALSRAGLSNVDILRIATRNGGDFITGRLSADERFGRVVPGYRADLILLDGNPLEDVGHLERSRLGVVAAGHWRSAEWFAGQLAAIRDEYSDVVIPGR